MKPWRHRLNLMSDRHRRTVVVTKSSEHRVIYRLAMPSVDMSARESKCWHKAEIAFILVTSFCVAGSRV